MQIAIKCAFPGPQRLWLWTLLLYTYLPQGTSVISIIIIQAGYTWMYALKWKKYTFMHQRRHLICQTVCGFIIIIIRCSIIPSKFTQTVKLFSCHSVCQHCWHGQWRTQDFRMGGVEVPQAPRGRAWGGYTSFPLGEGSGHPPQKMFRIFCWRYHILVHYDTFISFIIRQLEAF